VLWKASKACAFIRRSSARLNSSVGPLLDLISLRKSVLTLILVTLGIAIAIFVTNNISNAIDRRNVFDTVGLLGKIRWQLLEFRSKTGKYPNSQETYSILANATDSWGYPLKYVSWSSGKTDHFLLASPGKDGVWQHSDLRAYRSYLTGEKWSVDLDIVCSEGGFVQAHILE
jgi:hypothetical protein